MNLLTAFSVLYSHGLLREAVLGPSDWTLDPDRLPHTEISAVTYDTRTIAPGTLLFCKGAFRPEFLTGADGRGLTAYVSEKEYSHDTRAVGLIVTDVRKAMALLCAEFYGHPERQMTVIGITGTKGKTTTAYLVHAVLAQASGNRCALLSSESNCVDGHTWERSKLTTPESADLFALMRRAVDAGMRELVMEVSSQAYKTNRVYGITFDVGAFLNISPDHISPIEHPTFEDYFYCKRRLLRNSRRAIINDDLGGKSRLLREETLLAHCPVVGFSMHEGSDADVTGTPVSSDADGRRLSRFTLHLPDTTRTDGRRRSVDLGEYRLRLEGDFNYDNALAAVAICLAAGIRPDQQEDLHALECVSVPGRMQHFTSADGIEAYVDYAHNYLSLRALLAFAREKYPGAFVTVVTGATGGKALDRRHGLAKAADENADALIVTTDDPGPEDPADIARQMLADVHRTDLRTATVLDRQQAIEKAFECARQQRQADRQAGMTRTQVVLIAGKGDEPVQLVKGKSIPYGPDTDIVARLCGQAQ